MQKLVVKKLSGKLGYAIETANGEAVAMTYKHGVAGRKWARALVAAFNAQQGASAQASVRRTLEKALETVS